MTIFAEPSETLCGARHETQDAVCTRRYPHQDEWHQYEDLVTVKLRLSQTLTPCKWAEEIP